MKCELIRRDLKAYCDRELSLVRRLAVRRHLAGCAACREEIREMRKISETLQSTEQTEPLSSDLRTRILAEAARQGSPATDVSPLPTGERLGVRARHRFSPALVGGICAAVALVAFFAMRPLLPGQFANNAPVNEQLGYRPADLEQRATAQDQSMMKAQIERASGSRSDSGAGVGAIPVASTMPVARPVAAQSAPAPYRLDAKGAAPADEIVSLDRQVHREASVTVEMKDPEAAGDQVEETVKDAGGYVASNNLTTDGSGEKSAQMSVKVPVAQFDTVLGEIEKLGNITAKNVTGEDITGKVSDAGQAESVLEDEVQRSNARLAELGKRAKWQDEEDARELRIELAQARARVVLLHKLAALADIEVNLNQTAKPAPPAQTGFMSNLRGNGSAAFQSMLSTLGVVLTILIWVAAYIPIWGPVAFAVWYTRRYLRESRV